MQDAGEDTETSTQQNAGEEMHREKQNYKKGGRISKGEQFQDKQDKTEEQEEAAMQHQEISRQADQRK